MEKEAESQPKGHLTEKNPQQGVPQLTGSPEQGTARLGYPGTNQVFSPDSGEGRGETLPCRQGVTLWLARGLVKSQLGAAAPSFWHFLSAGYTFFC